MFNKLWWKCGLNEKFQMKGFLDVNFNIYADKIFCHFLRKLDFAKFSIQNMKIFFIKENHEKNPFIKF